MSDFNRQEIHQDFEEFFPVQAAVGKRYVSIPAAKLLAAIASVAVTAVLVFNTYVDCFATQIWQNSAVLNIRISNLQEDQNVTWQLTEQDGELVRQGQLDAGQTELPLENLDPDTKYIITFTTQEEGETKTLGDYHFTTGAPSGGGPSGPPAPDGPPTPTVTQSPAPTATPAPSLSPSPSPTTTPVVTATPTPVPVLPVVPTAAPSAQPSVEPSPSPEVPLPSAGTPSVSDITPGVDGGPANMTFNFPFSMNSTADYTNEFVDVEITYSSEDYGYPVDENAVVTVTAAPDTEGNVTVNLPIDVSQYGSATAKATLRYNRVNVATGEIETDLTLDSDDLNVQALFAGVESEDSNGLTITNLEADSETDKLTGTVTIDVGKGTYSAQNSVSQLSIYRIWFDIYDQQYNLVNTNRDISIDYDNLTAGNTTATITTDFDISLADLGLVQGGTYEVDVRANAEWLLNNNFAGASGAFGFAQFSYGDIEPEAGTSEISDYIAPTDNTYNGWVGQYSFIPNDAEIVNITIDETITEYSDINGTQAGTTTSSATYDAEQISTSEDGSQIYAEHTGHTTMDANNYMYRYQATPVLTYTMPGDTTQKQLTGPSLDIDPYFYITYGDTAQSANSMTINSVTSVEGTDVEMVEVNFSAQIKDIHAGNTGALTPMSVAVSYYSDNMGSNRIDVPADSYTVGTDGSVTVTNAVITLPAGRFNTDNKLSLTLNIDSIWTIKIADSNIEAGRTSASVSAVAEYIPPEQQSYMLLLDTTDVGLVYNIPAAVDMELLSVSMTYNNTTGLNEIPIAGGELVQIIYQFTGQVDTDALAINAQITPSITGSAIIYDTAIPGAGNVYTDAAPLSIILEYQVPEMVTSDITLTPHCEIFNQA